MADIEYTCTDCKGTCDVKEFHHKRSNYYQECWCGEKMLPTKEEDNLTRNVIEE